MGPQINRKTNLVFYSALLVILSCEKPNFRQSARNDLTYQICINTSNIIEATFTDDNGAPSVKIFEKNGDLLAKASINPLAPFLITRIENNKAELTYFVASGKDFERFLYAFKHDRFNPSKIGDVAVSYNFKIRDQYLTMPDKYIDEFQFDRKIKKMILFYKRQPIDSLPPSLLMVNYKELIGYDPNTQYHTNYLFKNPALFQIYFEKIANGLSN